MPCLKKDGNQRNENFVTLGKKHIGLRIQFSNNSGYSADLRTLLLWYRYGYGFFFIYENLRKLTEKIIVSKMIIIIVIIVTWIC